MENRPKWCLGKTWVSTSSSRDLRLSFENTPSVSVHPCVCVVGNETLSFPCYGQSYCPLVLLRRETSGSSAGFSHFLRHLLMIISQSRRRLSDILLHPDGDKKLYSILFDGSLIREALTISFDFDSCPLQVILQTSLLFCFNPATTHVLDSAKICCDQSCTSRHHDADLLDGFVNFS